MSSGIVCPSKFSFTGFKPACVVALAGRFHLWNNCGRFSWFITLTAYILSNSHCVPKIWGELT